MIISKDFPDDINETLKRIQHDLYWGLVGYLFHYSKDRYLRAVRLIGIETDLSKVIKEKSTFDHRILQAAYDKIASYFRFAHDNRGQMPLPFDKKTYEETLTQSWSTFFHKEARELSEIDWIAIPILMAVAFENTEPGYNAEDQLMNGLKLRYTSLPGD